MSPHTPCFSPEDILKKYWGYDSFRPLQKDIINSILSGHDTLGLMPTGGGKSITFQVPGMILDGLTIVVTPLISLMKDQVDNLRKRHIKAVFLHSGMTMRERNISMEHLRNGKAKFLYIAPERIHSEKFISELRQLKVSLIVIDEAHCISQWGYDFRPSYLNIKTLRTIFPSAPALALTATATPEVARDICRNLLFKDTAMFRMSFRRKNISYLVRYNETKIQDVLHILSRTSGSAIVYVRSRKRTHEIADFLSSNGISATPYHAGLDFELKAKRQSDWQMGLSRVIVATNAFGMGIDKPDVRVVIHFDMPPSLEEYYQEAGRAGRDGLPSFAVLIVGKTDAALLRRRVTENFPDRSFIKKIYEQVCIHMDIAMEEGYESIHEFDIDEFCTQHHYQTRQCLAALHLLGQAGYMQYLEESDRGTKVMILLTREELYDLRGLTPLAERVLQRMLRLYTGLFMEYQTINENTLASDLHTDTRKIYEALLELSRDKIISFIPRSRSPLIYLPTSREETQYIQIGKNIYEDRRENMKSRTEAMINYALDKNSCRENKMLEYFGESNKTDCRRCDVCRNKSSESFSGNRDYEKLITLTLQAIKDAPYGIDFRMLEHKLSIKSNELTNILNFLATEDFITIRENTYFPT